MKMTQFTIGVYPKANEVSKRCTHISNAIVYHLLDVYTVHATFIKINLSLHQTNVKQSLFRDDSIVEVRLKYDDRLLNDDYDIFFDALTLHIKHLIDILKSELHWPVEDFQYFQKIVEKVIKDKNNYRYKLNSLSLANTTLTRRVDVFLDLEVSKLALIGEIYGPENTFLRQEILFQESQGYMIHSLLEELRSEIIKERFVLIYKGNGEELSSIDLNLTSS